MPQNSINGMAFEAKPVYSKIARHPHGGRTLFTFSHKRFAEYFAVLPLIGNRDEELFEDILSDGKWRDVLVLLAELESEPNSKALALYCWNRLIAAYNILIKEGKTYSLELIHGLRFLRDAYLTRKHSLAHLHDNLNKLLGQQVRGAETLLEKKIATECVGLLNESEIGVSVLEVLKQNNDWLSETAIKSCFYLNSIEKSLEKSIVIYLDGDSIFHFIKKFNERIFLFKLSPLFGVPKCFCYVRLVDCFLIGLLYVLHIFYNPFAAVIYVGVIVLLLKAENPWQKIESFSLWNVFTSRFSNVFLVFYFSFLTTVINYLLWPTGFQIFRRDIPGWLIIVSLIALIPWYQIYYYLIKYRHLEHVLIDVVRLHREQFLTLSITPSAEQIDIPTLKRQIELFGRIGKTLGKILLGLILLLVAILLVTFLPEVYRIYFYGVFIGVCFAPYAFSIMNVFSAYKDFKANKNFVFESKITRSSISEHFLNLRTEKGRLIFVRKLGETNIRPEGEWPTKLPNVANDEASVRLAQLEESWCNLDH